MGEIAPQIAALLQDLDWSVLTGIFSGEMRTDVLRVAVAALFWRELNGIRKELKAVVDRVSNHENRIVILEKK